ncbi:hypothetical protein [Alteribacter populi]|uniref:hypothetical protein n=1 Tax=Alteribacter populi TaxID=2011011 RepID=UPI000BBB4598|nr:hypothetical protein [Alteribacter populi]
MNFIHWYDFITPTSPFAAMFFGILLTMIIALSMWFESKSAKTFLFAALSGSGATVLFVFLLTAFGAYG